MTTLAQTRERRSDLPSRKSREAAAQLSAALSGDWSRRLKEEKLAKIFLFLSLQGFIVLLWREHLTCRDGRQKFTYSELKAQGSREDQMMKDMKEQTVEEVATLRG